MPICRRSSFTSVDGSKMSSPLYFTLPVILTPGMRSFMRLSVLRNVDFPQPDGPMSAVMLFSGYVYVDVFKRLMSAVPKAEILYGNYMSLILASSSF